MVHLLIPMTINIASRTTASLENMVKHVKEFFGKALYNKSMAVGWNVILKKSLKWVYLKQI